jgi:uncharacterized protein YjbI with pentapeptide repeats/energy-coupling factor transporter ATP-binding protein EcfA2
MIEARRAAVRPRVFSAESGETLLLEDEVLRLAEAGVCAHVALVGPAGAGKTTALQHLAAVLPPEYGITLIDTPLPTDALSTPHCLVVQATTVRIEHSMVYWLASWQHDDLIEYLLTANRQRCAAVMARVQPADFALLGGLPELWRPVLDRLVADDRLPGPRQALHRYLQEHLSDTDLLERTRSACLNAELATDPDPISTLQGLARPGFAASLVRLLRLSSVSCLLAAERIAADLHGEADCDYLARRLPRSLVEATATLARNDPRSREHLERLLAGPSWSHAMSASLLVAIDPGWKPQSSSPPQFQGAYLDNAVWPDVKLAQGNLIDASLAGADLSDANLNEGWLSRTNLRRARLPAAWLAWVKATGADLSEANLAGVHAYQALFFAATLKGADLTAAKLEAASFGDACLQGACFRYAHLKQATLVGALIEDADFTGANLTKARLSKLCLRLARWDGACFTDADLNGCDLEELCLPAALFNGASLRGALLTGTSMPGASFQAASLVGAGLADIDWEGVDLRHADLRQASFHLGSTRSGLVGSPIACEGSRTGFYTDDFDDQTYKAPEEIRKANLCGADLRGANIKGVDFYLVDLRGALLDPGVAEMLRSGGAILDSPGCC